MRYGRLAARRPLGLGDLPRYLNNTLPIAPTTVAVPTVTDWGMLGNDRLGDCTIAGAAHLEMANAADNNEPIPVFTDTQVESVYLTLTHGQDTGLVEADVLHTWHTAGLFGSTIAGYAPVDHRSRDQLRRVIAAFGAAYLGVIVPDTAEQQFQAGQPWTVVDAARPVGGHAVPAIGYDTNYAYVVTWGKVQPVAWAWLDAYLEEAWAVISPQDAVVNLAALQADLALLGKV